MNDTIVIECGHCGRKIHWSISALGTCWFPYGKRFKSIDDFNLNKSKLKCSSCGAKDRINVTLIKTKETKITTEGTKTKDIHYQSNNSVTQNTITCPFDGTVYEKGGICPREYSHSQIAKHRKGSRYGEWLSRKND